MANELNVIHKVPPSKIKKTGPLHFDLYREYVSETSKGSYLQRLGLDPIRSLFFMRRHLRR